MKIVAIRGKNLASLEGEFMIDFTVEPLCSAGIRHYGQYRSRKINLAGCFVSGFV